MSKQFLLKRRLVVQNLKMVWSRSFIPKFFVWHSSRDIVRMKWRYFRACFYTEKKRSHWLKQWPIRKGLGDKKRRVVIGWGCHLDLVETLEQSTNGSSRGLGDLQGLTNYFCLQRCFRDLMKVASRTERWNGVRARARTENLSLL